MFVQDFVRIVGTVFENIESFMEGREKKQHDCISSRKFFPTPKKVQQFNAIIISSNFEFESLETHYS